MCLYSEVPQSLFALSAELNQDLFWQVQKPLFPSSHLNEQIHAPLRLEHQSTLASLMLQLKVERYSVSRTIVVQRSGQTSDEIIKAQNAVLLLLCLLQPDSTTDSSVCCFHFCSIKNNFLRFALHLHYCSKASFIVFAPDVRGGRGALRCTWTVEGQHGGCAMWGMPAHVVTGTAQWPRSSVLPRQLRLAESPTLPLSAPQRAPPAVPLSAPLYFTLWPASPWSSEKVSCIWFW